jgi:copper homeostasis protein
MTAARKKGVILNKYLYEVIVCTLKDALAAEAGGATRLEVISHYEAGGLTPDFDLVRSITRTVRIPARIMIRDEEDFTITDEKKIERLCEAIRSFRELPVDGFVLGFVKNGTIDHELVARLLSCAPKLKTTFHRAFELLPDPIAAIGELKRHSQIDCILTSGGPRPWAEKLADFDAWQRAARPEIDILIGGGTDWEAIRLFGERTLLRAFHVGRAVRRGEDLHGPVEREQVRQLADLIEATQITLGSGTPKAPTETER